MAGVPIAFSEVLNVSQLFQCIISFVVCFGERYLCGKTKNGFGAMTVLCAPQRYCVERERERLFYG